jgi:archaellum biogenesis protein FlaJ (TadC family)
MDRIRQIFLSLIGIGAFVFIFYLVFKDNPKFMIGFAITIAGFFMIALIIGLIWRIIDKRDEKKRTRPFK